MHKHGVGVSPDCKWCDLDRLMRELAGDVGRKNLERYVLIEFDSMDLDAILDDQSRSVAGVLLTVKWGDGPMVSAPEAATLAADILRTAMTDSESFDDLTVEGEVRYA